MQLHSFQLLLLLATSSNAAVVSGALLNFTNTTGPAITFAQRLKAAQLPTITLGPASNYGGSVTGASTPTITGSDIAVITTVPESSDDEAIVFVGSDRLKMMQAAYANNCPDLASPNCESSVQQAFGLNQQQLGLQTRNLAFLVLPWMAIYLAVLWARLESDVNSVSTIRLPKTDVAQISSVSAADTVVFATAGTNLVTLTRTASITAAATATATATLSSGLTISTATADGNGYSTNDIVLGIDPDTGAKLTAVVNSNKQCASSRKRSSMFDCAGNVAAIAIGQTGPGDALANLLLLPAGYQAPDLIPALAAVLPTVIAAGQQIAMLAANPTLLVSAATVILLAVYVELQSGAPTPTRVIIPASDIATSTSVATATSSSGWTCPAKDRWPECSNCGGQSANGNCVGFGIKYDNWWQGCGCLAGVPELPYKPFSSPQGLTSALAAFSALPSKVVLPAATQTADALPTGNCAHCIPSPVTGRYDIFFEQTVFVAGVNEEPSLTWSLSNSGSSDPMVFATAKSGNFTIPIQPGIFSVQWSGNPNSEDSKLLFVFTDANGDDWYWDESTNFPKFSGDVAQYNAQGVRQLRFSLRAMPSADNDQYRLHLLQQFDGKFSQVEATLFTDALNERIGGPSTSGTIAGDPMPGKVSISVKDPTSKKSEMRFTHAPAVWYSDTGEPGNSGLWCDQTEATDWKAWSQGAVKRDDGGLERRDDGGAEREFDCYFLGTPKTS